MNESQSCSWLLNFKKCCCLVHSHKFIHFVLSTDGLLDILRCFIVCDILIDCKDSCVGACAASNNANHAFSLSLMLSVRYIILCYLCIRKIDFQYNCEWLELCYKTSICSTLWEYFLVQTSERMRRTRATWAKPCVSFHCSMGSNYLKTPATFV